MRRRVLLFTLTLTMAVAACSEKSASGGADAGSPTGGQSPSDRGGDGPTEPLPNEPDVQPADPRPDPGPTEPDPGTSGSAR